MYFIKIIIEQLHKNIINILLKLFVLRSDILYILYINFYIILLDIIKSIKILITYHYTQNKCTYAYMLICAHSQIKHTFVCC